MTEAGGRDRADAMAAAHVIRDARPGDRAAVGPLWDACLLMHGVVPDPAAAGRTWGLVMAPGSTFGMRVALLGEEVVGFAVHSHQPNSWTGGEDGCLDTLFVAPGARGAGLGRALVDDLLLIGRARGWRTLFWHVRADNAAARALYDRYGAPDDYVRYRVAVPPSRDA